MEQSYAEMKLALRVLESLTARQHPAPKDVADLRVLAGPKARDIGIDELACDVIQKAIKHRARARMILEGAGGVVATVEPNSMRGDFD